MAGEKSEGIEKEFADDILKALDESQTINQYELDEAGFRVSGDLMVKMIGDVEHKFRRVAKGVYIYDGQYAQLNRRPMGEYL